MQSNDIFFKIQITLIFFVKFELKILNNKNKFN